MQPYSYETLLHAARAFVSYFFSFYTFFPQLLDGLRTDGGRTTLRLMNAVVDACRKGRQWEKALEKLSEMKGLGVVPDDFTYTAAIAACRQGRQWDKVWVCGLCLFL